MTRAEQMTLWHGQDGLIGWQYRDALFGAAPHAIRGVRVLNPSDIGAPFRDDEPMSQQAEARA